MVKKMANYTQPLRSVLEHWCDGEFYNNKSLIEVGRKKLFNFEYEMFDENYKVVFETHFIRNFFMREIGFETDDLFRFKLETWMMINLPYYNSLFQSTLLEYNPLYNYDVKTTHKKESNSNRFDKRQSNVNTKGNASNETNASQSSNSNSENTQNTSSTTNNDNFNRQLKSDTPDKRLAITTDNGNGVIEYATELDESKDLLKEDSQTDSTLNSKTNDTQNGETNSSSVSSMDSNQNDQLDSNVNNLEDFVSQTAGKNGNTTYPQMIKEYRESLIRVEKELFREMGELFMGIY